MKRTLRCASSRRAAYASFPAAISRGQQPDGRNPGKGYIRLALVQDAETTAEALHRLVEVLG